MKRLALALFMVLAVARMANAACTTTINLGLQICDFGDETWEVFTNANWNKLDLSFASPLSRSGVAVTLGTVPYTKGGTGQTTFSKGEVLAGNASSGLGKLATSTNGFALVLDSSQALGVKWAAVVSPPYSDAGNLLYSSVDSSIKLKVDLSDLSATSTLKAPAGADGTTLAVRTGIFTTGHCLKADANDVIVDSGDVCGGSGGTLDVRYHHAAKCLNTTASSEWDLPTSNPAVAACVTGTNTQKGVLDYANGASTLSAQFTEILPSYFTGTINVTLKWFSATTSGNVLWQVATACVADGATDDPAFSTASTVQDTTKGTANQLNDATIGGLIVSTCSAGYLMHVNVFRDPADALDDLADTARLIGVTLDIQ